jgi:plastocyanin
MRFTRVIVAAGLFMMLLPPAPASAATRTVDIPGNYFSPPTIRVHVGDTVRWFNDTSNNHTVTSNSDSDESFNSSTNCPGSIIFGNDCIKRGGSYSHTFDTRGTFTYHCKIHGSNVSFPNCGMCGRVVVVRKSSPTVTPTSPGPTPTGTATTASPSPSNSGSVSPTPGGVSPDSSPKASGQGGSSSTATIALAAVGVALLAGSGLLVYRTMIRR